MKTYKVLEVCEADAFYRDNLVGLLVKGTAEKREDWEGWVFFEGKTANKFYFENPGKMKKKGASINFYRARLLEVK